MSDITVVGSGTVGMAMALGAALQQREVVLLDQHQLLPPSQLPWQRVHAINPSSQQFLARIGVWQCLPQNRYGVYQRMVVWDPGAQAEIAFDCRDVAAPCLGWIVDELAVKQAMADLVEQQVLIETLPQQILSELIFNQDAARWITTLRQGSTRLILGCDGARSWVRARVGFDCAAAHYGHDALVCHLRSEIPHGNVAYQCFTAQGPLALLPLSHPHHLSLVYSASPEYLAPWMAMEDEAFAQAVATQVGYRLGSFSQVSPRYSYPLVERQVTPKVKPRCALLGDALHTFHPLAGLGVNLGLSDVSQLLHSFGDSGYAFDHHLTLRHYARARARDVFATTSVMRQLVGAFSQRSIVPQWARGLGMNVVDRSPTLKRALIGVAADL